MSALDQLESVNVVHLKGTRATSIEHVDLSVSGQRCGSHGTKTDSRDVSQMREFFAGISHTTGTMERQQGGLFDTKGLPEYGAV